MIYYLLFGLGFYIGLCSVNADGFIKANTASIIRGLLLGIVFWPIELIVQIFFTLERLKK